MVFRVSNATLKTSLDLPGATWLRCSKCEDAWYTSKEEQASHWHIHRRTCCAPDAAGVERLDARGCVEALQASITAVFDGKPARSLHLSRIIRRMRTLLDRSEAAQIEKGMSEESRLPPGGFLSRMLGGLRGGGDPDSAYLEHEGQKAVRGLRGLPPSRESDNLFAVLWGAPGMAELMMSEDMLSELDRECHASFPDGLPADPLDDSAQEALRLRFDARYNARGRLNSAGAQFAWTFYTLLGASAIATTSVSHSSVHDGVGTLRSGPVASAAARRTAELWMRSATRDCCGDAVASGPGAILTIIEGTARPSGSAPLGAELAPGVSVDALASACFESTVSAPGAKYAVRLLTRIASEPARWAGLSTPVRGRAVCKLLQSFGSGSELQVMGPSAERDWATTPKYPILAAASGASHKERIAVWSAAASYAQRCPYPDTAAFFHYLLRGVARSGCDAMDVPLDAANLQWLEAVNPGATSECAAEARECVIAAAAVPEGAPRGYTAKWLARWDEACRLAQADFDMHGSIRKTRPAKAASVSSPAVAVASPREESAGLSWGSVPVAERNAISRAWPAFDPLDLAFLQSTNTPAEHDLLRSAHGDLSQVVQLRRSVADGDNPSQPSLRTGPLAQVRLLFEYPASIRPDEGAVAGGSAVLPTRLAQPRPCTACGASGASSRCSGCGGAYYCSAACQSSHWKLGHKLECREAARRVALPPAKPSIYGIFHSARRPAAERKLGARGGGGAGGNAPVWLLCHMYEPAGADEPYTKLMGRPAGMFVRSLKESGAQDTYRVVPVGDVVGLAKTMPCFRDGTTDIDPNRVLLLDPDFLGAADGGPASDDHRDRDAGADSDSDSEEEGGTDSADGPSTCCVV